MFEDYRDEELAFEARYAAEATETCDLCGKPSVPCECRAHKECMDYEQFLADRESLEV